jgi:hypothetical protein
MARGGDEIMSVQSFDDWRGGHYTRASPARSPAVASPRIGGLMEPRSESHNASIRPDPPVTPGRARRRRQVNGQQSGGVKTALRSSFTSLGGMSMLSASDDRDDTSTTGRGAGPKNFSSNESVVSEISVLSNTIDDLGLGDDE